MRPKIFLTVAIPTYNRTDKLEQILIQLKKQKNQSFYVLVSDDGSTNNTEKMIKRYQKIMPHLLYHKNAVNLGYSGNVCKLYEMAKTRYIWFMCDDDTILPDAIQGILDAINIYKPVVAVFNCTWVNSYGQMKTAGVTSNVVHDNFKKFTDYNLLVRLTFLSIIVVEKRLSIKKIKETNYKDNIFFQITLGLFLLSDKFVYCEIAHSVLHRNVGYKYGEFLKFCVVDQIKAELIIKTRFSKKKILTLARQQLPVVLQLYFSQKVGLFKYNGRPTFETIKQVITYYGFYSIPIFFFMLVYLLTPSILVKFLYFMKLLTIYRYAEAVKVYKTLVNRAFIDVRSTRFTEYR